MENSIKDDEDLFPDDQNTYQKEKVLYPPLMKL